MARNPENAGRSNATLAAWTAAGFGIATGLAGLIYFVIGLYAFPRQEGVELRAQVQTMSNLIEKSESRIETLINIQTENAFQIRSLMSNMKRIHRDELN